MCPCKCLILMLFLVGVCGPVLARGLAPAKEEFALRDRWIADHFRAPAPMVRSHKAAGQPAAGLRVIYNHGDLQLNARAGEPIKIGEAIYKGGLYCHAPSRVVVTLPGPAKSFTSHIGVDTRAGGGSVVFCVSARGRQLLRSSVMHGGEPAQAVEVDLADSDAFTLEVTDAGDGITCDQANWADAKAVLADGREVRLGDLPVLGPELIHRGSWSLPFSFQYGGKSSDDILRTWRRSSTTRRLDARRTQTTHKYVDGRTGLELKCIAVKYSDFPAVEWTLHFANTGKTDTPVISDIRAIDTTFTRGKTGEFVLHRIKGDTCSAESYQPVDETLGPRASRHIAPAGGRPTSGAFPYFNIERPGGGIIAIVSWAGQWAADFARDDKTGLRVSAGQELTRFKLHPGEQVRSPMVVLQFYTGDRLRAQNIWRHWMLAHNSPRVRGKAIRPFLTTTICGMFAGLRSSEKDAEEFGNRYFAEGFKPTYWNTDAGWYPCDPKIGWPQTGTWQPDPERYPKGLRQLSDYLHAHGVKCMVWFEPERVHPGTWLAENRPEWVHGGKNGGLLRLDQPDCRKWITDRIDSLLTSEGIDLYRQDFNIDPLSYWRSDEPEDRQGITENHHVTSYFAFWDELRRRHPGLVMDTCASGGRRNDLETLRRALPLLRSDYEFEPDGNQALTYGLSSWLPLYGAGNYQSTLYVHHSSLTPFHGLAADVRKPDVDFGMIRRVVADWKVASELMIGDYYPLTEWSLDKSRWIAFQFDRPDLGRGVVQAFRRQENPNAQVRLKLHGLDATAVYKLRDLCSTWTGSHTGKELMDEGLLVSVPSSPGDALIVYTR